MRAPRCGVLGRGHVLRLEERLGGGAVSGAQLFAKLENPGGEGGALRVEGSLQIPDLGPVGGPLGLQGVLQLRCVDEGRRTLGFERCPQVPDAADKATRS